MTIDLAQVQLLEQAVRLAEQRLASAPPPLRTAARLALARAEAALAAVWSANLAEQVTAADAVLAGTRSTDVLALLPAGLEAKLQPAQHRLRLRVWPETIARATHDPALTAAERDAGQRYWTTAGRSRTDDESAWQTLASLLGPRRAAWVAQVLTPVNAADLADGAAPVFPDVTLADAANPFVPAALVPDQWIVLGFRAGTQVLAHVGPVVTRPLVAGLDTSPDALAGASASDGPITLPPRMRWMSDFAAAAEAGMAMDIPVPADLDQLDQLFVVGIRGGADGPQELQELLTGHRFGRGLAFVPQGTPSNNSPSGSSGLPAREDAISSAFALERTPRGYGAPGATGERFAAALGIAPATVATAASSGAVPEIGQEPDGFEPGIAQAIRTLLWMPLLGHLLEDLIGVPPARVEVVREHFIASVVAAGPVPAIRVGDQPYGVLPVTSLSSFTGMPGEPVDATLLSVLRAIPQISQTMHLDTDRAEDLLNFTARPRSFLEAVMSPGTPSFSEFAGNAAWLNEHSNGAISTAWAQGALKTLTGDWAYPTGFSLENMDQLPVRTLADEATPAALAALAAAGPDTLRASAPQGSTLTRIARYATLLEWARLAQAVGEAALSGTSFLDGARTASAANRAVWLDLLEHASDASVPAPFPVAPDTTARILALTGRLDQPAASCPGQPRLAAFRAALEVLAQVPPTQLAAIAYPVLDLTHAREDAWQTSLATGRLATLRTAGTMGSVAGGFGWLLDVRAETQLPPFAAEYIHAPSHDHVAAAAVLRSASIRAGDAGGSYADIDLSSRRVRLARWLAAGVSGGRPLTELLGARFERRLTDAGGGGLLPQLRSDFPSTLSSGILDGLTLHASPPAIRDAAFTAALAELNDSFDALADAVTAEGVYHVVRGYPARALIDVDDVVRGNLAPTLEVTRSPAPATTLTHRVAAVVPTAAPAPGWPTSESPRAQVDPILDAWCGYLLGPASATVLTVDAADSDGSPLEIPCGLDMLGIGALDVLAATRDAGRELTERALAAARTSRPGLAGAAVRADTAWKDLLRLGSRGQRLLARAQPLTASALTLPGTPAGKDDETTGDDAANLPARATAARARLETLRDKLSAATVPASVISEAAGFGIVLPGTAFDVPPSPDDRAALTAAVQRRLAAAAGRTTARDQLRALVDGVMGLIAVQAPDPAVLATAAPDSTAPGTMVLAEPARCAGWLETMGRVRPALTPLTDIMALAEMSGRAAAPPLRIAQAPWSPGDPWIALGWTNPQTQAPATGRLSLVLHAPADLDPAGRLGGFLIDAWADAVPAAGRDTALAVRHNGPNTRAPQTMLLAVAPDTSVPAWTTATLAACLRETLDAVILRQGILFLYRPLTFLGHRPDGAGISYDGGEPVT
jgi:hypothetical protein